MTIQEITDYCKELSSQVNDTFSIPVKINGRLSKCLGRVTIHRNENNEWTPLCLELSKRVTQYAEEEDLLAVIRHEWCHYYITKTTREDHDHDEKFKELCQRFDAVEKRSTRIHYTVPIDELYKYTVYCPTCNRVIDRFMRMNKTLRMLDFCTCKKCGNGGLYYKQNW